MTFGKRLREARLKEHMTQPALAEAIDVAVRTYQSYEQDERLPTINTLINLADILNVSTDYLLGRTEKKN